MENDRTSVEETPETEPEQVENMDSDEIAIGENQIVEEIVSETVVIETTSIEEEKLEGETVSEPTNEEIRQQLAEELDALVGRVQEVSPRYEPPPFSPKRLMMLLSESLARLSPANARRLLEQLRSGVFRDVLDLDTWKGIWYIINFSIDSQRDLIRRRFSGEFETDEWGYDPEVVAAVMPFFQFLYKRYWRVQVSGIEYVPEEGRAILVSNHSGQLPFDGSMVSLAVLNELPTQRVVRTLFTNWSPTLPLLSSLFVKMGQALSSEENGVRLLEQDQLVAVYPEGYRGIGKLYKDRYHLARFGMGDFVKMALRTGAPIIPVSVVGAEETYISLAKSDFIAKLTGFPYFPISPTFPWFGLIGLVPIPTKWYIDFGEPIAVDQYGPNSESNMILVSQITDQVRNVIQNMIYARLATRRSVLLG